MVPSTSSGLMQQGYSFLATCSLRLMPCIQPPKPVFRACVFTLNKTHVATATQMCLAQWCPCSPYPFSLQQHVRLDMRPLASRDGDLKCHQEPWGAERQELNENSPH